MRYFGAAYSTLDGYLCSRGQVRFTGHLPLLVPLTSSRDYWLKILDNGGPLGTAGHAPSLTANSEVFGVVV